ncbi:MAG TPA: type II secretion system F family protein [Pirellulales bacterium]|jgi:type II secretory pathway component PulF
MPQSSFPFRAISADGQPVQAAIVAADAAQAQAMLVELGLTSIELAPAAPLPVRSLSAAELMQLAQQLEMLTRSGLPLPPGLRAAAQEHPQKRLSAALREIARQLEAGQTLDEALASQSQLAKGNFGRLLEAGVRTGTLSELLTELLDIERSSRELGNAMRLAVSYPLLILFGFVILAICVSMFLLPGLGQAYTHSFDLFGHEPKLPSATKLVMWFAGSRVAWIVAIVSGVMLLIALLMKWFVEPAARWRLIEWLPYVGPMVLWRNVATWARLVGLFLDHEIPAPEALRMAAAGVRDANVAAESRSLAQLTAAGNSMAASFTAASSLPTSLAPLLRWGEDAGALPAALRTAGDMFENRVRIRAALLQIVLPPLVFVFIAFVTLSTWYVLLAPLIELINSLTGGR